MSCNITYNYCLPYIICLKDLKLSFSKSLIFLYFTILWSDNDLSLQAKIELLINIAQNTLKSKVNMIISVL